MYARCIIMWNAALEKEWCHMHESEGYLFIFFISVSLSGGKITRFNNECNVLIGR